MKKICRQFVVAFCTAAAFAGGSLYGQTPKPDRNNVFGTLAFVGGTHLGGRAALDFKTKNGWLIGAVGGFFSGEARELPGDYSLYYRKRFFSNEPQPLKDNGLFGAITMGRSIALKPNMALQGRIGPSWNQFSVYENFRFETAYTFSIFGPGSAYTVYGYDVVERKTAGLYFGTSLAFATDGIMGATIGFSGNLTPVRSYFGFDIGIPHRWGRRKASPPDWESIIKGCLRSELQNSEAGTTAPGNRVTGVFPRRKKPSIRAFPQGTQGCSVAARSGTHVPYGNSKEYQKRNFQSNI